MPLPKRRHSNSRTGIRRAHDALTVASYTHCEHCNAIIHPHTVCDTCGYYRNKPLITIKQKEKKAKRPKK